MKFYACYKNCVIITDDYSKKEIMEGVHLRNLFDDLRGTRYPFIDVFDENSKFITRLLKNKAAA